MVGKLVVGVTTPLVAATDAEGAYVVVGKTIDIARMPDASGGSVSGACCGA